MTLGSHDWSRWYPIADKELRARGIEPSLESAAKPDDAIAAPPHRTRSRVVAIVMVVLVIGIAALRFLLP